MNEFIQHMPDSKYGVAYTIPTEDYATVEELKLMHEKNEKLQALKMYKNRTEKGLKESKDVLDLYQSVIHQLGYEYVMENMTLSVPIIKGAKIVKYFSFDEKNYALYKIESETIFEIENERDFVIRDSFKDGVAVYVNSYRKLWEMCSDFSVYRKIINTLV